MTTDKLNHFFKGVAIAMMAALMLMVAMALALIETFISSTGLQNRNPLRNSKSAAREATERSPERRLPLKGEPRLL